MLGCFDGLETLRVRCCTKQPRNRVCQRPPTLFLLTWWREMLSETSFVPSLLNNFFRVSPHSCKGASQPHMITKEHT